MKKMLLAVAVAVSLASAGCADFTKFLKESDDLIASVAPKLDGLLAMGSQLLGRAEKVPGDVPGAKDLVKKLGENQGLLEKLKGDINGAKGKLDEAAKAGNGDLVNKVLEEQKANATTGVESAEKTLAGFKGEVTALETKAVEVAAAKAKAAAEAAAKAKAEEAAKAMYSRALPGGYGLQGAVNGIESQLLGFIEDAKRPVDKTTWFNFDRLNFKTGSAELDMDASKAQLTNMAEILKAFPKVKLKVGGYTDNQGKPADNLKLSTQRAQAVSTALTGMGIKADRLSPEGYGSQFPVCAANDTDACRAQNRRIAVRVTAK